MPERPAPHDPERCGCGCGLLIAVAGGLLIWTLIASLFGIRAVLVAFLAIVAFGAWLAWDGDRKRP